MERVIDLRTGSGADAGLLERTETGGLLGSSLLRDEPLRAHLGSQEEPKFLLRNKKAGIHVTGPDEERRIEPGSDYQALALVTDVNVLFAVGQPEGDVIERVPLVDVLTATESRDGFLATDLELETMDSGTWTVPVRGEVEPVVEYLETAAQAWITADRLLAECEDALADGRRALEDGDRDAAVSALADVPVDLEAAEERIAGLGAAAEAAVGGRASRLRHLAREQGRELAARRGGTAHAAAHRSWEDRDYEAAMAAFDRSIEAYETALGIDAHEPPDWRLQARHRAAVRERELLRVAPRIDADAARRQAASAETPEAALEHWERALALYREAVALDWGRGERGFALDRDRMRDRAAAAARAAIDAGADATRRFLAAGDAVSQQEGPGAARLAYDRADEHLTLALDLARELLPDRLDDLEDLRAKIDRRLDGSGPPPDDPVEASPPVDDVEALVGSLDRPTSAEPPAGTPVATEDSPTDADEAAASGDTDARTSALGNAGAETGSGESRDGPSPDDTVPAIRRVEPGGGDPSPPRRSERIPATPLVRGDSSPASRRTGTDAGGDPGDGPTPAIRLAGGADDDVGSDGTEAAGDGPGDEGRAADSDPSDGDTGDDREPTNVRGEPDEEAAPPDDGPTNPDDGAATDASPAPEPPADPPTENGSGDPVESVAGDDGPAPEPPTSADGVAAAVDDLDQSAFVDLVSDVLAENGWTTTVFSVSSETVYDVVAVGDGTGGAPEGDRLLVWAIHRPTGPPVDATAVDRCATTGERSEGADHVMVVTSGTLTPTATERADERDVAVIDGPTLAERMHDEGLQSLLVPYL